MRLEPDVLRYVRPAHPVCEPMVELARGFVRIRRVSVSMEDLVFLGVGDAPESVSVRDTRKG
jgi:hypothetical protein